MKKSGLADSPFFYVPTEQTEVATSPPDSQKLPQKQSTIQREAPVEPDQPADRATPLKRKKPISRTGGIRADDATMLPRHHDTVVPRYHETMVESIRAAVRQFGKEAATHRFTPEEKKAIADMIYAYKAHKIRTSENEISRIAVNFVIDDYRENGENSILHKVLIALNG